MNKGKFIVIYGANNLGKSTQVKLLIQALEDKNIPVKRLKYPIYDLEPTGSQLNAILRQDLKLPEEEVQELFVQNRRDYQKKLQEDLENGFWIVSEDYKGTGIAWGMVRGLPLEKLEKMNQGLIDEDLAIILYGERFKHAIEKNHRNEENDDIWETAQDSHLFLAEKYNWKKVYANNSVDQVHKEIMSLVDTILYPQ